MHAALVRKRALADVGLVLLGRQVGELIDEVRELGQPAQVFGADRMAAELQLEPGDDRNQIGVAAALAEPVDRTLHLCRAVLDGRQRVGDG